MNELVFEVIEEADGGYCAECLTQCIVSEGNSWDDLRANVREAVRGTISISPTNLPSASASALCVMELLPQENPARPVGPRGR